MDEVKAIITLRSGKELKQPTHKVVEQGQEDKETEDLLMKLEENLLLLLLLAYPMKPVGGARWVVDASAARR